MPIHNYRYQLTTSHCEAIFMLTFEIHKYSNDIMMNL